METSRTIVGVDTAKRVFQFYWVDMETSDEVNVRLDRKMFLRHFANWLLCLVATESCGENAALDIATAGAGSRVPDSTSEDGQSVRARK